MGTLKEIVLLKNYDDYLKLYTTGSIEYDGELVEYDDDSIYFTPEDELNYVTVDAIQEITGIKTFVQQIGIKNPNGTIDYIKHINNNLLISTSEGTNLLNIDEGLSKIYAFNKELAFKSDITDATGTKIYYTGVTDPVESVTFNSDPQTQIDAKTDKVSAWKVKTWDGDLPTVIGRGTIWTDGTHTYNSYQNKQHELDVSTGIWKLKDWGISFTGSYVWHDGDRVCLSESGNHYVLDKETQTWTSHSWEGTEEFSGDTVWNDGEYCYCTDGTSNYRKLISSNTWETVAWSYTDGAGNVVGRLGLITKDAVWKDNDNIYYRGSYVLDKVNKRWDPKTWTNPPNLYLTTAIWSDGIDTYSGLTHVLNRDSDTWIDIDLATVSGVTASGLWSLNNKVYFGTSHEFIHLKDSPALLDTVGNLIVGTPKASLPIGSIITSAIPLIDATVHLLDGSVISQNGIYSDFVKLLKDLITQGYSLTSTQEEFDADLLSTGNCGKFVIDDEAGTIRLPKITQFIQGLTSLTDIGTSLAAGLPNIKGRIDSGWGAYGFDAFGYATGAFYKVGTYGWRVSATSTSTDQERFGNAEFNADLGATKQGIYRDDVTTVQPAATQYPYYIVLANTYQPDIVVDINNYAAELNVLSGEVANCVTLNTEQIITADKILTNGTNIKSEIGNMVSSDGTHVHVGNQRQNTRINGIEQRPDYATSTGVTDIALVSDVMAPTADRIDNVLNRTAIGVYDYYAPSNGYFRIFCTIPAGGKCYVTNETTQLSFGYDNAVAGGNSISQSMNGFVPCSKGDRILLTIELKNLDAMWDTRFVRAVGG